MRKETEIESAYDYIKNYEKSQEDEEFEQLEMLRKSFNEEKSKMRGYQITISKKGIPMQVVNKFIKEVEAIGYRYIKPDNVFGFCSHITFDAREIGAEACGESEECQKDK